MGFSLNNFSSCPTGNVRLVECASCVLQDWTGRHHSMPCWRFIWSQNGIWLEESPGEKRYIDRDQIVLVQPPFFDYLGELVTDGEALGSNASGSGTDHEHAVVFRIIGANTPRDGLQLHGCDR